MSKGLRNIKDPVEKTKVVRRRLTEKKGGLGYLAALDYSNKKGDSL